MIDMPPGVVESRAEELEARKARLSQCIGTGQITLLFTEIYTFKDGIKKLEKDDFGRISERVLGVFRDDPRRFEEKEREYLIVDCRGGEGVENVQDVADDMAAFLYLKLGSKDDQGKPLAPEQVETESRQLFSSFMAEFEQYPQTAHVLPEDDFNENLQAQGDNGASDVRFSSINSDVRQAPQQKASYGLVVTNQKFILSRRTDVSTNNDRDVTEILERICVVDGSNITYTNTSSAERVWHGDWIPRVSPPLPILESVGEEEIKRLKAQAPFKMFQLLQSDPTRVTPLLFSKPTEQNTFKSIHESNTDQAVSLGKKMLAEFREDMRPGRS